MKRILHMLVLALWMLPLSQAWAFSAREPVIATGEVYRVIDGDTFQVNIDAGAYAEIKRQALGNPDRMRYLNDRYKSVRVRLANINTRESVHPDASRNSQAGKQVSQHVKRLAEGRGTRLYCYDFGDNGRVICSMTVQGASGSFDLGEYLIAEGYSQYVTHWGQNPFYHREYRLAEH